MELFDPENPRPIHFMGIAGAGMGALAAVALRRGVAVTGSDIDPANAADLIHAGVPVLTGHEPAHIEGVRAVVHTSAVSADHPVLRAAREAGIPVIRRAEALGALVATGLVVGVAGTHGKTTTTAMATEAMVAGGLDPTGIVGGRVDDWGGNARLGSDALFVVEADEFDRSFLALDPEVALVTNVEPEHLDCYGSEAALMDAFADFAGRADRVIVGGDDAGALALATRLERTAWRVGTGPDCDLRLEDVELRRDGTSARLCLADGARVAIRLIVPGLHNLRNAAMAVAAASAVGAEAQPAADVLASFAGVGRRFQVLGTGADVTVVDDYAHHSTEVRATLEAARQRFPTARIIAAFQPHLYSRTQQQADDLGRALAAADVVMVTDIYPAREAPIAGVTGRLVADAATRAGADVRWVERRDDLADALLELAHPGDVVLTLGAGDITKVAGEVFDRLTGEAA